MSSKRAASEDAAQMIDKPIVENLGCMKGPQPLHFLSAGGGVYVAEEENSGAELDPGPSGPLSLKMIHRIIFRALRAPRKNFSFRSKEALIK